MANYFTVLCVLASLAVITWCHPTNIEKVKSDAKCLEGEVLDPTGKCVKGTVAAAPAPKPTLSPEQKAKRKEVKMARKQKKRTIKKKLDDEIKEIKRLVFEGLEKGTIDLKCPDGKEFNEQGECASEAVPATAADVPVDEKKAQKAKRMEMRLEKELEKVLKKEIQMEMRAKKRKEQKKEKSVKKTNANGARKPGNTDSLKTEAINSVAENKKTAEVKPAADLSGSDVAKEVVGGVAL